MTDRQLLEQALEALEYYQHRNIEWEDFDEQVITAIRERLANAGARLQSRSDVEQPEHDRMEDNLAMVAAPVQEPVVWVRADGMKAMVADEKAAWIEAGQPDLVEDYNVPAYTIPPYVATPLAAPVKEKNSG